MKDYEGEYLPEHFEDRVFEDRVWEANSARRWERLEELRANPVHAGKFRYVGEKADFITQFICAYGGESRADWNARVSRLWLDACDKTRAHRSAWAILAELGVL